MKHLQKLNSLSIPAIIIIGFGFLIISNLLLSVIAIRFDLSKGQAYTLSPATKKILKTLPGPVTVKFYVSSELPSRLIPLKTEVSDFLNEYKKENTGKVVVKVVDPKKDTTVANEIQEIGIPELRFSQVEQNKYQLSSAYFGLGIFAGDKKEAIPQITDITNLEYNVTSLIYKLTKKERSKIAIIGSNQSSDPNSDPYMVIKAILANQYDIEPVDLSSESIKDIDLSYKMTILIASDNKKFSDQEIEKIKNYIAGGGNILFFADGVWVNNNLTTQAADHNLFSFFQQYGITMEKNFVLSPSAEYVNFGNSLYQFLTPYPFWVKSNNFLPKSEYFSNVAPLTFPWTSSLNIKQKNGQSVQVLVSSPDQSWEQTNTFELSPEKIQPPNSSKKIRSFPLVADVKINTNHIIIVPSSRFLVSQYLSKTSGNIDFVFNLINNLASGGVLSGIRSRSLNFYQIPGMSDQQKDIMKYSNIALLPLLFGMYGAWRMMKRK